MNKSLSQFTWNCVRVQNNENWNVCLIYDSDYAMMPNSRKLLGTKTCCNSCMSAWL